MSVKLADLIIETVLKDENVRHSMDQLEARTKEGGSRIKDALSTGFKVAMAAGVAAVVAGTAAIVKSLGSATDAFETMNLVAASLGPATAKFNRDLAEIARNARRSRFELMDGVSSIIAMSRSMGFGAEAAGEFSAANAKAATGLSSFFNIADNQVLQDFRMGLAGSSEVMTKYGIDVRETTLKQKALNQGLIESAGDILPRNIRAQLFFQQIVEQAGDALGTTGIQINSYEDALRALQGATTDAERTSRSAANAWRGVQSAIHDTSVGIGLVALPFWEKLVNVGADFAQRIGPQIVTGTENMVRGWLQRLGNMEAGTARSLGRTAGFLFAFGRLVVGWGANIVAALAQGITGAVGLVVKAINLIGQVIGSLLKPGSPPKFLPDLDKWGAEAANAYLSGWTQADFGTLRDVGQQVESILRGQGQEGEGLIGRVAGTRQAVAEAIQRFKETGKVGVDTYDRIRRAAGRAADSVVGLVRRQIDLARATERVRGLQEQLTAIQERRQALQEQRELTDIQAQLARGGLTAAQRQDLLLRGQEIRLQRQLRAAQKEQDERQTELDIFRERLGVQQESLDLTQRLADILAKAAGAAGKLKDGVAGLGEELANNIKGAIPNLEDLGILPNFEEEFGKIQELVDEELKPGFEEGQTAFDTFSEGISEKLKPLTDLVADLRDRTDELREKLEPLASAFKSWTDSMIGTPEGLQKILDLLIGIGSAFATFKILSLLVGLAGTLSGLASAFGGLVSAIMGAGGVSAALGAVVALLGGPVTVAIALISLAVGGLVIAWRRDFGGIQEKTEVVWDALRDIFGDWDNFMEVILPAAIADFKGDLRKLLDFIETPFAAGMDKARKFFNDLKSSVDDAKKAIGSFASDMKQKIVDKVQGWADKISSLPFVSHSPPPMLIGLEAVNEQLLRFEQLIRSLPAPNLTLSANSMVSPVAPAGLANLVPAAAPAVVQSAPIQVEVKVDRITSDVDLDDLAWRVARRIKEKR